MCPVPSLFGHHFCFEPQRVSFLGPQKTQVADDDSSEVHIGKEFGAPTPPLIGCTRS